MKTIILCGGQGTRMKEETEFKPKALVDVAGKPIILHIMEHYAKHGYNEFVLALGYRADDIKEYFYKASLMGNGCGLNADGSWYEMNQLQGLKVQFVDTGVETLPGERILRCMGYAGYGDFMVTYCDAVSDIDIKKLVNYHKLHGRTGTMSVVHPHSKFGAVEVENHVVKNFVEKPVLDSVVNGGFMVFKRDFFNSLRPREMEHDGLKRLIAEEQLMAYKHDGFWFAVDTHKELDELNKLARQEKRPW